MRPLPDTHVFLWAVAGSPRLKQATRRFIESAEQMYVSAASVWEVAIKARLGKLEADPSALVTAIESSGFIELPVRATHAAGVCELPLHRRDPFDRMLIAQAMAEPLRLLTADAVLVRYSDLVVLV